MIVCSCNVLSDTEIRDAVNGRTCPRTPGAVYKCLGCRPNCGSCIATLRTIINEALEEASSADTSCQARCELETEDLCSL